MVILQHATNMYKIRGNKHYKGLRLSMAEVEVILVHHHSHNNANITELKERGKLEV